MEIDGFEDLPKLFISPIEKLMDEFNGSVKEFRGLFKVPRENTNLLSINTLHQQICITSQDQFESTNGERNLFGLDFSQDEQIAFGSRTTKYSTSVLISLVAIFFFISFLSFLV